MSDRSVAVSYQRFGIPAPRVSPTLTTSPKRNSSLSPLGSCMTGGMRYLVQTRLGDEYEERYITVAAPEDPRAAVAIAKFLRVPDPLDPESDPLRTAIVIDEETEEECFDGIKRAEHQLAQLDRAIHVRLSRIGRERAPCVTDADMRAFVHSHSWVAAGLEGAADASDG